MSSPLLDAAKALLAEWDRPVRPGRIEACIEALTAAVDATEASDPHCRVALLCDQQNCGWQVLRLSPSTDPCPLCGADRLRSEVTA